MKKYHPEPYWSEVAERISNRNEIKIIAGDDEPYYRYKRSKFLKMLDSLDFHRKRVLEIGSGPGGNLEFVKKTNPTELQGVDISQAMIDLANKNLNDPSIEVKKTDGTSLPYKDNRFDLVFAATVLQHNTDESMLKELIGEMCRVCNNEIHIFERIDDPISGDDLCLGRPIKYYQSIFKENGFLLSNTKFINIHISYLICGTLRKLLNPKSRKEGEPLNRISFVLQKASLPFSKILDRIYPVRRDLALLSFSKSKKI